MPRAPSPSPRLLSAPVLPGVVGPATGIAAFVAAYLLLDWLSFIHAVNAFAVTPVEPPARARRRAPR